MSIRSLAQIIKSTFLFYWNKFSYIGFIKIAVYLLNGR